MSRHQVISGLRGIGVIALYRSLAMAGIILTAAAALHARQAPADTRGVPSIPGVQTVPHGPMTFNGRPLPPRLLNRFARAQQPGVHTDGTGQGAGPVTVSVLQHFATPAWQGATPVGGLLRGEDGSFYGATSSGGLGFGVVYQIDHAGTERVLYEFKGGADGSYPAGSLVSDAAGNLYGVTTYGGNAVCGPMGCGVLYKLDKTGKETVLYTFLGEGDGAYPQSVVRDSAGNFFGIHYEPIGGNYAREGAVFKVDSSGNETDLHDFTGEADGGMPVGGLIVDSAGILYGTTSYGGLPGACSDLGCGLVFKMDQSGNETVLYNFTGGADGSGPEANLIRDASGNLYSTTAAGGDYGNGAIFKLDKAGNETVLYSLKGGDEGTELDAGVVSDEEGNLYGTTETGGVYGNGVVFKLSKSGAYTVLHAFQGGSSDGSQPQSGVVLVGDSISGVTTGGGPVGFGVMYTLDKSGKETVTSAFRSPAGGSYPSGGVVANSVGDLFGTTNAGGLYNQGVVYKLDLWGKETTVYTFMGGADGGSPNGVIVDSSGNLYGSAGVGGAFTPCAFTNAGCGAIFKVDSTGKETTLHSFKGTDGASPQGNLVRDPEGNLYGATYNGGDLNGCYAQGCGEIFKLDEDGKLTILHAFTGGADGAFPVGDLILDSKGNLYGAAFSGGASNAGVIFKLDRSGHETVLYTFKGGNDGEFPAGGLIRDEAGNLYGVTQSGGASNSGVVFKLNTNGIETVLYSFTGLTDGNSPNFGLALDSAGNLYGTTSSGGDLSACNGTGCGVVFQVTPSGMETPLYAFTGADDGSGPNGNLLRDAARNLYGTAGGGLEGGGVVFKIQP